MINAYSLINQAHLAYEKLLRFIPNPPTAPRIVSRHWCILFLPSLIWERNKLIHRTRLNETIGNSGSETYATLESASCLYETAVLNEDVNIQLVFKAPHQRRKTHIGRFIRSLPVTTVFRHRRNSLPNEAFTKVQDIPTLIPEYLILEYLALADTERAFVGADSLMRMLCHPDRRKRAAADKICMAIKRRLRTIISRGDYPYATKRILKRLDFITPWSESVAESRFKAQLFVRGFPQPEQQKFVMVDGQVFFVDAAWLKYGIFAEVDGQIKYAKADAKLILEAQQQREVLLLKIFRKIVRFSWNDISEGAKFAVLKSYFPPGTMKP